MTEKGLKESINNLFRSLLTLITYVVFYLSKERGKIYSLINKNYKVYSIL